MDGVQMTTHGRRHGPEHVPWSPRLLPPQRAEEEGAQSTPGEKRDGIRPRVDPRRKCFDRVADGQRVGEEGVRVAGMGKRIIVEPVKSTFNSCARRDNRLEMHFDRSEDLEESLNETSSSNGSFGRL